MLEGLLLNGHQIDMVTAVPNPHHVAYDESLAVSGVHTTRIEMNQVQKLAGLSKNKLFLFLKSIAYRWMTRHEVYDHLKSMVNHLDCVDLKTNQYDYIISSSDPKSSHLFVLKLLEQQRESFRGKWIQIWGDPFFADITQKSKNARKIKEEEYRLLKAADMVFYVSQLTLEQQKRMYPACSEKMRYTPIPYVQEVVAETRKLRGALTVELAYCGDYSPDVRNLEPLYETVNMSNNLHLVICGGSSKPFQTTEAVLVKGRVPYSVTCEVENNADILVFVANKAGGQIPGKIYQYAGTNKPILFILDGDSRTLKEQFAKYDRFIFADNTRQSIERGIREIIDNDSMYSPLAEFSKEYIMSEFISNISQ